MPLEDLEGPDKFINALDRNNPVGGADTKSSLDNHDRGIKNTLLNTFPQLTGAVQATQDLINTWETRIQNLELIEGAKFPIGSIELTTVNYNPTQYLPGTWQLYAEGRALIGAGTGAGLSPRVGGDKMGSEDAVVVQHTHVMDPAGSHKHNIKVNTDATGSPIKITAGSDGGTSATLVDYTSSDGQHDHPLEETGVDGAGLNMQPSIAVYVWERVS